MGFVGLDVERVRRGVDAVGDEGAVVGRQQGAAVGRFFAAAPRDRQQPERRRAVVGEGPGRERLPFFGRVGEVVAAFGDASLPQQLQELARFAERGDGRLRRPVEVGFGRHVGPHREGLGGAARQQRQAAGDLRAGHRRDPKVERGVARGGVAAGIQRQLPQQLAVGAVGADQLVDAFAAGDPAHPQPDQRAEGARRHRVVVRDAGAGGRRAEDLVGDRRRRLRPCPGDQRRGEAPKHRRPRRQRRRRRGNR